MATWDEFAAAEPEMAELGLRQYRKFGLAYLGTTRNDGSPRVNPVCPVIAEGRVFVATSPHSPKLRDLLRDGRYVLHLLPGKEEEEFWIRGVAKLVSDPGTRAKVIEAAVGITRIRPAEQLLEYDIEEAGTTVWLDFQTPNHRPSRRFWRARDS
ncbi:MAG: pyridoxamine 5'-phosphate oxidase family protein [Dehalococcoidia bacterium]